MTSAEPRICFITAIYGNYEATCKPFVQQIQYTPNSDGSYTESALPVDFVCFTDNPHMVANGWTIDTTPYHQLNPSPLDNGSMVNSLANNKHTFNIAKYYKQAFQNIPRLKKYDCIVWLDGTVEIICPTTASYLLNKIIRTGIIGWNHEDRGGILAEETKASLFPRYTSNFWNGQFQPVQDVVAQYNAYVDDGYDESLWKHLNRFNNNLGVWLTCFIAFNNKAPEISEFLNMWYMQTLKYTTQDQIGFPYVCQKLMMIPYTMPNMEVGGDKPHERTLFYIKHQHGM